MKRYRADLHTKEWAQIRLAVLERDGWRCQIPRNGFICGADLRGRDARPTADHIIPFAMGGTMTMENLRASCFSCNSRRGARQARGHRLRMPRANASRFG